MQQVKLDSFLGMNNLLPDTQLLDEEQQKRYVHDARNVDFTDKGTVRRRTGYTKVLDGACHSVFTGADMTLVVRNGQLCRVHKRFDTWSTAPLVDVQGRLSYAPVDDTVYASDGHTLWAVTAATCVEATQLAPQALTAAPIQGGLQPARYRFVCTAVDSAGIESGASAEAVLDLSMRGGISLSAHGGTGTLRVYMTEPDGDVLYYLRDMQANETLEVQSPPYLVEQCPTLGMEPLPAGTVLRYIAGRMYSVRGKVLYMSRPYAPTLYDPINDWLQFEDEITLVADADDGVYIAADKTYFLPYDQSGLREVLPYGALHGGAVQSQDGSLLWFSEAGAVQAKAGGQVNNIQHDKTEVQAAHDSHAAQMVTEQGGMRQYVACQPKTGDAIGVAQVGGFFHIRSEKGGA